MIVLLSWPTFLAYCIKMGVGGGSLWAYRYCCISISLLSLFSLTWLPFHAFSWDSPCALCILFPLSLVLNGVFIISVIIIGHHCSFYSTSLWSDLIHLHLWCISRSLLLGGAGSPLLPLQSASYLPARHHSEQDYPQNVKWPPSALHIDPLLKLNISKGTLDPSVDCLNQIIIL